VVIRIDSPGGAVAPSQEIHDAVIRLREKKPVVASFGSVAASGGYYVAVAADSIVSPPGALTGSIGVIFSFLTADELMKKAGVQLQVFKSGPIKDVGTFHREPTEAERALLGEVIDDVYDQFVSTVVAGRGMSREEVLAIADGRIMTGRQALELGLIDRLGGLHEAVQLAAELGGIDGEPQVETKERRLRYLRDLLFETRDRLLPGLDFPRLEYRFR
jgi:protease-4